MSACKTGQDPFSPKRLLAVLAVFAWAAPAAGVGIDSIHAGNVTPFSLDLIWETTEVATPGLEVYADAGGTVSLEGEVGVRFYPLHLGDPRVSDDAGERARARALRTETAARQLAHVRVSGLEPSTTYWLRPKAVNEEGEDVTEGGPLPLVEVKTAERNAFIAESRQLLLDFAAEGASASEGAVVRVGVPGLAYPLFAVVGDGPVATEAYVNLDHLLDAAGQTNLSPTEPLQLTLRLFGAGVAAGAMNHTVSYGGGTVTAAVTMVPFTPDTSGPDGFAFDPIGPQQVGEVFTVTIRALDASGEALTTYEGSVELTGNLSLQSGAGTTPAFAEGVLADHPVVIDEAGESILTATETGGTASGESEAFTVAAVVRHLLTNALPAEGGTVEGGGSHADGTTVTLEAAPSDGFAFERWVGAPVADAHSATTTLFMGGDHSVTAVFVESTAITSYEEWKYGAFLRAAGDPTVTAPDYDLDHDGWPNLLEYFFGTSPLFSDREGRGPLLVSGTEGLLLRYPRRTAATDVSMRIEVSRTLGGDWTEHSPAPADVSVQDLGNGMQEVEVQLPAPDSEDPGFYRIHVLKTTP